MLRLEGLIDWKLQAAVIDRLLRLPTSLFREYTVGDFVDRSMGIDAARRIFTGRALRSDDGRPVRLVQHRLDVLLRPQARTDRACC